MGNVFSCSGDALVTCCWNECFHERAMYICKLEENLYALRTAFQELKDARDDVMRRVNIAEQQNLMRLNQVQGWLSRVTNVEMEVENLIRDDPQGLCLGGCCSKNCKFTYKFGKRVSQKLKAVVDLKNKKFEEVAGEVPAHPVEEIPCEPTVGLESTFESVWSCLQDDQLGIVGLHGTGGVGKTTLLKQINNKFSDTPNNFDIVIWVVVSRDLKLEKIQEDIGEKIGFSDKQWNQWKCKSRDQKAKDIFKVLKQKKFVLLLDDIWERIDLIEVGIPCQNIQNGSKVVFTTRSDEVCYLMEAQKKIKVKCLVREKAWELFQKKVGRETLSSHPDIPKLAETMATKCGGLPLALIIIGRAMAGKRRPQQWQDAIEDLAKISGMKNEVFHLLKFSYDNLPDDEVKSCFLYCALFPEDFLIYKTDLIDYWIGEGFWDEYDDREKAKSRGDEIIDILLQANLLEEGKNYVKLHDIIREMALWIARECGDLVETIKVPDVERWERARRVSLMTKSIENLTETPKCPNLLTLFLHKNDLRTIASEFFQFMPSLRVLDLSKNWSFKELPLGISELVSLEYLNLSDTGIQQLPDELKTLVKLKYLNLEYAFHLNRISHQFISSFLKLEVLRMFCCGHVVEAVEDSIVSKSNNNMLIEELMCLKHLNTLTINILSDCALQRFLNFQKLQSCTHRLLLSHLEQLNGSSLENVECLEELYIDKCESLQELKAQWASEGREIQVPNDLHNSLILNGRCFHSLRIVTINKISKLRDLTWLSLAPNLNCLAVWNCSKIEEIISGEKLDEVEEVVGNLKPFGKLESFFLDSLPELKSIYRSALSFPHLKLIGVRRCPKLKKLPLNLNSAKERKMVIGGEEDWWQELEWEDEDTQKFFLPCFNDVNSESSSS